MNTILSEIVDRLKAGNFNLSVEDLQTISISVQRLLEMDNTEIAQDGPMIDELVDLITIGNITYNYTDRDNLPIEDGCYDILVAKLLNISPDRFTPGAIPIQPDTSAKYQGGLDKDEPEIIKPFIVMKDEEMQKFKDAIYPEILTMNKKFDPRANLERPFITRDTDSQYITKRLRTVSHNYPNLVGTLEKCKFVTNKQAEDVGVLDAPNVKVLERDFFAPLLTEGIINDTFPIQMIGTLKYDGVSIEADVNTEIISARTRGDTDYNLASDLTPILGGYKFPNAVPLDEPIGMKFEAIILHHDLMRLNKMFGTSYINGRTAIIGILGSSDARKYRDFITLVPLQADFGPDVEPPDRITEIEFLNKYYANREYLRWVMFSDCFTKLLFNIKRYVEEAEFFRSWTMFMFDGVVVEFLDKDLRKILGRKNSINKYAMAIKFNPLKRSATFLGYTYTIGSNGAITPMIHYTPVEFLGSIHTKSTGSSYARFKELNLYIGDIIEVTYMNDVMPYVSKPDIEHNRQNHNRPQSASEMFPTHCPCCGTTLVESSNGKSMLCPNDDCDERITRRATSMLKRLGFKDFAESAVEALRIKSFSQLMKFTVDDLEPLGPTNKIKFYEEIQNLRMNPLPDYRIIGALGFVNVAEKKWKQIFQHITLAELYGYIAAGEELPWEDDGSSLLERLTTIPGIGAATAHTIVSGLWSFKRDIQFIIANHLYIESAICSDEDDIKYKIRLSGFRDDELCASLELFPFIDCDPESSVTKDTTILLVPYVGYTSTKVAKAQKYGIPVIAVEQFMEGPSNYIPEITDIVEF